MKVLSVSFNKSILIFLMVLFCGFGFSDESSARGLPDFTELVKESSPAVVNIRTTSSSNGGNFGPGIPGVPQLDENDPMYEFFKRFFPPGDNQQRRPPRRQGPPGGPQPRGVGSGFIISPDGFVLSNHHVVAGADKVIVTMADRREFYADIIGSDQRTDVALLKIEGKKLPFLKLGNP